jgi:hypothetical protein
MKKKRKFLLPFVFLCTFIAATATFVEALNFQDYTNITVMADSDEFILWDADGSGSNQVRNVTWASIEADIAPQWSKIQGVPAGFADGSDDGLTTVDWSIITGIPAGFADGTDDGADINWTSLTGLTSPADTDEILINESGTNRKINWSALQLDIEVDWSNIQNMPAGFADGNDDTGVGSGAFSDSADPVVLNTTSKDVQIGAAQVNSAKTSIDGDADQVQLAIQGHSTQTANLFEAENSAGTVVASLDNSGNMTVNSLTTSGSATPTVEFRDTDGTDNDINAQIVANLTDTGSGSEDTDVTFSQQIAGSMTAFLTADADGVITAARDVVVPTEVYGASWNGSSEVPTKDAVYDQIEGLGGGSGDVTGAGDCASGACLDGTSDGGTYIRLYDGDSNYTEINNGDANQSADLKWVLPDSNGTVGQVLNIASVVSNTITLGWTSNGSGSDTNAIRDIFMPANAMQGLLASGTIAPVLVDEGTNVDVAVAHFDNTGDSCRAATFTVPADVESGTSVTFYIPWYSPDVTSGNVIWDVRHTSGISEGTSWDQSLTTETAAADAVQGTVDQITVTTWTETLSNLGWTADEVVFLNVCRDQDNASDTMAGSAYALGLGVKLLRD